MNQLNGFPLDRPKENDWNQFFKSKAFRGYKINRASKELKNARECSYDAQTHCLTLIQKSGKIITINVAKVDKKSHRCSFSRWNHERRMKNSKYAKDFNDRMSALAKHLMPQENSKSAKTSAVSLKQSVHLASKSESSSEIAVDNTLLVPSLPFLSSIDLNQHPILNEVINDLSFDSMQSLASVSLSDLIGLKNQVVVNLIKEKMDVLINSYQLEERLKRLGINPDATNLLYPWMESPLRHLLMMDDELSQLKLSDIKKEEGNLFIACVDARITRLAKLQAPFDQSTLTDVSILDLDIVKVPLLKADTINKIAKDLPSWAFYYISSKEISKINVSKLTDFQIEGLFSSEKNAQALTKEQVDYSINRVNTQLLRHLSDDQILKLDFTLVDKPIVCALFPNIERKNKLLKRLEKNQINPIHSFFEYSHWRVLEAKQIYELDLSTINKSTFSKIFPLIDKTKTILKGMDKVQIESIYRHFDYSHWRALEAKQIYEMDLSTINKSTFSKIFPLIDKTKTILKGMDKKQINDIQQHFEWFHKNALGIK